MKKIFAFLLLGMFGASSLYAADGITRLKDVSTIKADQANQGALKGADKQRDLVNQQKQLRDQQKSFDANMQKPGGSATPKNPALQQQILIGLRPANELKISLARLGATLREMNTAHGRSPRDAALPALATQARAQLTELRNMTDRLKTGFVNADKHVNSNGGQPSVDELRRKFDEMAKELEAKDRMGNFEIQRLMSQYNQAETLSSNVQKKADDTASAVISKI